MLYLQLNAAVRRNRVPIRTEWIITVPPLYNFHRKQNFWNAPFHTHFEIIISKSHEILAELFSEKMFKYMFYFYFFFFPTFWTNWQPAISMGNFIRSRKILTGGLNKSSCLSSLIIFPANKHQDVDFIVFATDIHIGFNVRCYIWLLWYSQIL